MEETYRSNMKENSNFDTMRTPWSSLKACVHLPLLVVLLRTPRMAAYT
jgi:hypothetical protein